MATCSNCKFWVAKADVPIGKRAIAEDGGECRRYAPRGGELYVTNRSDDYVSAILFPFGVTDGRDWCGEFQPQEPKP